MPIRASERSGLGEAAKGLSEHASAIARLELKLVLVELKEKVAALGLGAGLAIGAAIVALFGLGAAIATVTAAIALVLPTWVALLIVTAALFMVAAGLGAAALRALKRGTPPVPELAIEEAKLTVEAVRSNGHH
jgi:hypothetical protein